MKPRRDCPQPTACSLQPVFQYHPSGWRVWKASAPATLYLHGPGGQLLCSYSDTGGGTYTEPVSFAGHLVYTLKGGTNASGNLDYDTIRTDRLGSTRAVNGVARNYYPFGEEMTAPQGGDQYKFASTYRDSATGLDYAVNRYYAGGTARFLTPDPYQASGGPASPQSWNRYSYVHSDPLNFYDPAGLDDTPVPPPSTPPATATPPPASPTPTAPGPAAPGNSSGTPSTSTIPGNPEGIGQLVTGLNGLTAPLQNLTVGTALVFFGVGTCVGSIALAPGVFTVGGPAAGVLYSVHIPLICGGGGVMAYTGGRVIWNTIQDIVEAWRDNEED